MKTQQFTGYLRAYYHDLAGHFFSSFNNEDAYGNTFASRDDIVGFRGVCQARSHVFTFPVLIAFAMDRDELKEFVSEEDAALLQAKQREVLTKLRSGLATIGLVEVACFDQEPSGYALVARLADPKQTFKKAAHQLTKLLWDLAD